MTAPTSAPGLICVLGPPGVGKTTLVEGLVEHTAAGIVRVRSLVNWYRRHPDADAALLESDDELGWIPDASVEAILSLAVEADPFASPTVVLESLPGTPAQVHMVASIAEARSESIVIVDLDASDEELARRVSSRRVCRGCDADSNEDPHNPARADPNAPALCLRCGAVLSRRPSDTAHAFARRLARYRSLSPHIRREAASTGIPIVRLDRDVDPAACLGLVLDALSRPAHLGATDRDSLPSSRSGGNR